MRRSLFKSRSGGCEPRRRIIPAGVSRRAAAALVASVAAAGSASVVAFGDVIGTPNGGHLVAVGPTSGSNGFPVWYQDDTDDPKTNRLTLCLDPNDANCIMADLPDPTKPVSFPDNFPDEAFYQAVDNGIDLPAQPGGKAGTATTVLALEAAFSNNVTDGDQIVFGRVRFQYRGLVPNGKYTITHPYGVDEVTAEADGSVFVTEDIGISSFAAAMKSRIGPFLKWDPAVAPAAPAGYLGDPNVDHAITGSPYNTNFVKIEGPGLGDLQPDGTRAAGSITNDQFSVMGKYATNGGVDVDRVTYSREAGATDSGTLSVFANSHLEGQSIQVSDTADPKHFDATTLRGAKGAYAAQVDFTGGVPATVKVTNAGDVPADSKDAKVVDAVTGEAIYDADTETLSVSAESSDKAEVPALTAEGLGDLPADGSDLVVTPLAAPPANVTVNSGAGGTATLPVQMTGAGFAPIPVMPFAGTNQEVVKGTTVQLDGTGSSGPIKTYSWKQLPGGPTVDLQNADTATPTFVAPDPAPDASTKLTFELTVDGPGGPLTATVDVTVFGAAAEIVVNAGPDQTVTQGGAVTLDATGSSPEAKTFSWKQAGAPTDPQVTLTGADTATPKFTFPKTNATLTFEVTASGGGGSATDTVQVTAPADRLTLSRAQFTRSNNEWRIEGSSNVFGPGVSVTAYPGPTATGTPINAAPAAVDTLGAFRIRLSGVPAALRPVNNAAFGPANQQTITLKSTSGGTLTASFTVK